MDFLIDKVYNEDCLQGMQRIPDGSVDAIITDLPYKVLHKDNPNAQWDRRIPLDLLWEQFKRIRAEQSQPALDFNTQSEQ